MIQILRMLLVSFMLTALVGSRVLCADEPAGKKPASTEPTAAAAKEPRVLVTISKETTFITSPLRQDGYVDYIEALNLRYSEGVTPENNAAVLFWQAIGPGPIPQEIREEYFRRLGMEVPPEKGNYFVNIDRFLREQDRVNSEVNAESSIDDDKSFMKGIGQHDVAMARLWSEQEFPEIAAWLKVNERPLALVVEGLKRPRRYNPSIAGGEGTVMSVRVLGDSESRGIARALVARAMLRLHGGRVDEASNDLLACRRLARLEAEGWTIVEGLIAISMHRIAFNGEMQLLYHGQLTAGQAARMRKGLASLAPMPKMVDKLDIGERLSSLDMTCMLAREGLGSWWKLTDDHEPEKKRPFLIKKEFIDWDLILRDSNGWYDRLVAAFQRPARKDRVKDLESFDDGVKTLVGEWRSSFLSSMWENPRNGFSRTLSVAINGMMLPAITAVHNPEDLATMRFELTKLAFTLAEYRADQGSYPDRLDALVPKYLPAIPRDLFNDSALHYERKGAGYELYSVGVNGKDDGGFEDELQNQDDLTIRIPVAKKP